MIGKSLILVAFAVASASAASISKEPKVVNGTDANIAEFPFMASLRRNNAHSCGATIINKWFLLTAAHCLQSSVESYSVQYATTVIGREGTHVVGVAEIISHEDYLPANQYINDIGIVRLSEPIENPLNDYQVRLPISGSYEATGTPAVLAGWGLNATGGAVMTNLQKVDLQIYSAYDCDQIHRSKVHYTNICGGVPDGYKGQCSGDSGGPLLVSGVQVGIVSWSVKPCTVPPYPGVYTGVAHYIDWISRTTGIDFKLNIFLSAPNSS